jgi:hypothetical protein
MQQNTKEIQKRYEGFLQTACLWNNVGIYNMHQFKIETKSIQINAKIDEKLRLGKYIERFVSFQLAQEKTITILCENIQIQQEKRTLGELDCILLKGKKPIHLEIVYKFYLYDATVGQTEIAHFIGPNRKDSLVEKLNKLKEKQLPLLYSKECQTFLKTINLKALELEQQVFFKAQLFVPFLTSNINLKQLNETCIVGFYINRKELNLFTAYKFYIPIKKDWLVVPHKDVNWLTFNKFNEASKPYLERSFSPLCWLKNTNGTLQKFFLVWW